MNLGPALTSETMYRGASGSVTWEGRIVPDASEFAEFVRGPVSKRVRDEEAETEFESELGALATTGMATEHLERLLRAVPEPQASDIGEAIAEVILTQDEDRKVYWPWNTVRDRKTPRASLPGADLVGFCRKDGVVLLLFGEVKTSADQSVPPRVMSGTSGMPWQLEKSARRLDIHHALLLWLQRRCMDAEQRALFQSAVARYLDSDGREFLLVGVLLRDTDPAEADVAGRARELADVLTAPTRTEITAWYMPVPIADWPKLMQGGTS